MKFHNVFLMLAFAGHAIAEEEPVDDLDQDLDDLGDLDDDILETAPAEDGPDFDLEMPQELKSQRVRHCYTYAVTKVQTKREEFQQMVQSVVQAHSMEAEQATNTIVMSWMMACYHNFDEAGLTKAAPQTLSDEQEEMVFAQGKAQTASKAQWQTLQGEVMKINEEQQRQGGGQQQGQGPAASRQVGTGYQGGFMYIFGVFGLIFGAGALVVMKLSKPSEETKDKLYSGKATKKAEKVARELAKKKM